MRSIVPAVLLLLLCACSPRHPATSADLVADAKGRLHYGQLSFEPCALTSPMGGSVEARCTSFQVPEDHDNPDGRKIELGLALVPARGRAEADPVFLIAGGPGQSAIDSFPQVSAAFGDIGRSRHILLLDARGTGRSNPLRCEQGLDEGGLEEGLSPELRAKAILACRHELEKIADLRLYGTYQHIQDIEAVRKAVGAPSVNLVGVSYGTRVAQQYAALYPDRARALVLDSAVPNDVVLGQDHARFLENALDAQFARCKDDAACATNLGDPRDNLAKARQLLKQGKLASVRYRHPVSGKWEQGSPSFAHLSGLLRLYAYNPMTTSLLPSILHEAANGRFETMMAQAHMLGEQMGQTLYVGMALSVSCTEDADDLVVKPEDAGTVMGAEFAKRIKEGCEHWPRGTRPPDFRKPLQGDIPVLVLAGEFDPVTPPSDAQRIVDGLPNARLLLLPGQGHSVMSVGCAPKLMARFIEDASVEDLNAACLDDLAAFPPFAGRHGWEP